MRWWRKLDRLLPAVCWWCGAAGDQGCSLCRHCASQLPWLGAQVCPMCASVVAHRGPCGRCLLSPPCVARTRAALRFEGLARTLVHAFKFKGDLTAGRVLAEALACRVSAYTRSGVLIPIPSTARRRGQRGFDPAIEVARHVGSRLRLKVDTRGLRRHGDGAPQSSMGGRARRRANARDMFHVKLSHRPDGPLVLVDDVLTTGATSDAAAKALAQANVPAAELWVCARTL